MPRSPHRAQSTIAPDPYMTAWADLRRRRRAMLIAAVGYLVGVPTIGAVGWGRRMHLGLVLFGACLVVTAWAGRFRCPCCGDWFSRARRDGLLNRWCNGCGIGIGTPSPRAGIL